MFHLLKQALDIGLVMRWVVEKIVGLQKVVDDVVDAIVCVGGVDIW